MIRARLLLCLLLALAAPAAWPQGAPLGPEFRVNTATSGRQADASVAVAAGGDFVVVWTDAYEDGSTHGIFGQRFAASGLPQGGEFRVNTYTSGIQTTPSVGIDALGNFVVVWSSDAQDGSSFGVFGQRYAAAGPPLGPEFRVNTYTTNLQAGGRVAVDSAGGFVVVWQSAAQDGSSAGVFAQRYDGAGSALGGEFRVNTYTTGDQQRPAAGSDSSGNFVVAWQSDGQDGNYQGVYAQRYDGAGAPQGPEFRATTTTVERQGFPAVGRNGAAAPSFVVAWQGYGQDGSDYGIFAQRVAPSGGPVGPEFRVNAYTTSWQMVPAVAMDASGNFVVVWISGDQDGSSHGIFAQRYAGSGSALGPEFRVNTYTTGIQGAPWVAADDVGNFVVVWSSYGQDGSHYGVFGQRYGQIVPVELTRFDVE
jgi:hypothetical protein